MFSKTVSCLLALTLGLLLFNVGVNDALDCYECSAGEGCGLDFHRNSSLVTITCCPDNRSGYHAVCYIYTKGNLLSGTTTSRGCTYYWAYEGASWCDGHPSCKECKSDLCNGGYWNMN